ncbi:hypothetical protein KOI35_46860 [Actinoplanes bogorensis]|uniref:DUF5302 domain-containing protein n=1 Tax=Paractinoplanes bogorensis TaxID=1610840 RepID=A0ABS5Z7X1_9ACTN|nr:hypothetical protein [Actinoplanes bogorensis]MBU2671044.1 hypothetical protein [Actinoplanes bogorensis]
MPDTTPDETAPDENEPEVEEFANRAARRAKGKGGAKPGTFGQGQGQAPHGRGSVQSPRQYGNRRSG